jgi:DNA-binding NarL/FixJ family response regulator
MIAVLLVMGDTPDRVVLRQRMEAAPDLVVAGQVAHWADVGRWVRASPADVALVDLSGSSLDGVAVTRRVLAVSPRTAVIVLAAPGDMDRAVHALAVGAHAYLPAASAPQTVLAAVRSAAGAPGRTAEPRPGGSTANPAVVLTGRQRDALRLAAADWSDEQIGARLGISARTVAVHLRRAADRIGVRHRADAVHWLRAGSGEVS